MLTGGALADASAFAGFLACLAPAVLGALVSMGALADAVLVPELVGKSEADSAGLSDVSALDSVGKRCRRSAWPAPVAGCASRSI